MLISLAAVPLALILRKVKPGAPPSERARRCRSHPIRHWSTAIVAMAGAESAAHSRAYTPQRGLTSISSG